MTLDVLYLDDDVLDDVGQIDQPRAKLGRPKKHGDRSVLRSGLYLSDPDLPKVSATKSWWLGVPPDQFAKAAAAEQERMQESKIGKQRGLLPQDVF